MRSVFLNKTVCLVCLLLIPIVVLFFMWMAKHQLVSHLLALLLSTNPSPPIQQIHLSYGVNPSEMVVMWATHVSVHSAVSYALVEGSPPVLINFESVGVTQRTFKEGNPEGLQYLHRAVMKVRRSF